MTETYQAYCVKCKTKRDISHAQAVYTQNGAPGTKGVCPVCGTTLFRMGVTPEHKDVPKPERTATAKKRPQTKKASKKVANKEPTPRKRGSGKLVIVESPAKARSVG